MRIIHCLLDYILGSLDFITQKFNLHTKRKRLLKEARRSQIPLYGCWYVDSFDPDSDEYYFIDPVEKFIISIIEEHPEDAASVIRMWFSEDCITEQELEEIFPLRTSLQEFCKFLAVYKFIRAGGTDDARELLEKYLGSEKAKDILNRLTENDSTQGKPP